MHFKRLLHGIILLCTTLGQTACDRPQEAVTSPAWQGHTDSIVRAILKDMYNDPALTLQRFDSLQHTMADTASRLRVELYKAVTRKQSGDSLAADQTQDRVIAWCRTHPGNNGLEGLAWNHRGVAYQLAGRLDKAQECYDLSCRLLEGTDMTESLINAYINAADTYSQRGMYPIASLRYRRAHFIADSTGLYHLLPAVNSGLGQIHSHLENFKEAHQYLDEAEKELAHETDGGRFFFYLTRGNCYFFERRYDEALAVFAKARAVADKMGNAESIIRVEGNMGEALLYAGRTAEASAYIARGKDYADRHPEAAPSLRFYLYSLALDLAISNNQTAKADSILKHCIDTTGVKAPNYIQMYYERMQRYAEKRGDWQQAYGYQTLANRLNDSLKSRQTLNNIAEMRLRYEQDTTLLHQNMVIADYKVRTSRQHSYIVAAIAGLIILALVTTIFIGISRYKANRRYRNQVKQMAKLRMDIVQNRMQPHYIFNVLGTILPKFSHYPELSHTIGVLIDTLRGNLMAAGKTEIQLSEELKAVKRFVELHHLTNAKRPIVEWHIAPNVPKLMAVPAMSLQIPVENALKHAFKPLTEVSRIDISLRYEEGYLQMIITDNGQGYQPGNIRSTGRDTGTGLRVLARTIEILNTRNTAQATFHIGNRTDSKKGTEVRLAIPADYTWEL